MASRAVMLVDLDYFFAQCEERRNPIIRDRPVVVCVFSGRSEDSGAVSTANYAAREYGVKSGIPIFLAKKKLENADAVFLPVDHEFYDQVSDRIMTILKGYADSFEQVGVDEAYLDVSQKTGGDFDVAKELARKIKTNVKSQEGISCSVGIGPNKLVAKIASDIQKPDGLTAVRAEEVEGFLAPLAVDRLIGVGRKTSEKMQTLGIITIGDLGRYDVQRLIGIFGKSLGTYFHDAALGIDDEPVKERGEVESISRIFTLKEDTRNLDAILDDANKLCDDVHATLKQQGYSFKSAGIVMVMTDMSIRSRSKTLEKPTNDLEALKKATRELLAKFLEESELEVRRVGVRISSFVETQKSQKSLADFIS